MLLQIRDDFRPDFIADSGQCFRWEQIGEKKYRIPAFGECLIIRQNAFDTFELSCDEEEYDRIWRGYFDMGNDYSAIRCRIDEDEDGFLFRACEAGKGIRILDQDIWETLISFIISQNRNIPAIKKSIEILCRLAGEKRFDAEGNTYYTFPGPEAVCALNEEAVAECKLGYRDRYIVEAAKSVASGKLDLEVLSGESSEEVEKTLLSLLGVGKKVASCVMLFGFHFLDYFPIDTWIKKVLASEYPGGYPYERYSPYNGVYQQYMFEYYRRI